jgi:cell division protein FtsL
MSQKSLKIVAASLWLLVLVTAAAVVYVNNSGRMLFTEMDRLIAERDQLNIEWGRLQLEQSTYTTPSSVEQKAVSRLHMSAPVPSEVKLIER